MTCAKRQVTATLILPDGRRFVGTNGCANPQLVCPRAAGEGYAKCREICRQGGHAEQMALAAARGETMMIAGAVMFIEGHSEFCGECLSAMCGANVQRLVVGASDAAPAKPELTS